jgi:DNA-binding NarL/FixJ family response regulator
VAAAVCRYGDLENPIVVLQIGSKELDGLNALQSLKRLAIRPKIVAVCNGKNEGTRRLLRAAGASAIVDLSANICSITDSVARLIAAD